MSYQIIFVKSIAKKLKKYPTSDVAKILKKAASLSGNPYPVGCKKLSGLSESLWRIRVGNYRIIYIVQEEIKVVKVTKIGHRKDIYE